MVSSLMSGLLGVWVMGISTIDVFEFENEAEQRRYNALIAEFLSLIHI